MEQLSTGPSITEMLATLSQFHQQENNVPGHVLQHGREFIPQELNAQEIALFEGIEWQRYRPKDCFYNSQSLVLHLWVKHQDQDERLRYVEGYITTDSLPVPPILHAWLSVNGKPVDPTLRWGKWQQPNQGPDQAQLHYYGVEMEIDSLLHIIKHNAHISLLDDWQCGWPMLQAEGPARKTQ